MEFTHKSNEVALYNDNGELLAEITFPNINEHTVNINHTFVDPSLRGQGIAGQLMKEATEEIRSQHKHAIPTCSYAIKWFQEHPEEQDIIE